MQKNNPRLNISYLWKWITLLSVGGVLLFTGACDFQSPADFKMPTWFVDIKFPLVQQRYGLGEMIDSSLIFPHGKQGMQLVFEDTLPPRSIDPNYLTVNVNVDTGVTETVQSTDLSTVRVDTALNFVIPLGDSLLTTTGIVHFPDNSDRVVDSTVWNPIARAFVIPAEMQDIEIPLPVDADQLPDFVTSVEGFIIKADVTGDSSAFQTTVKNNGLPTDITDVKIYFSTGTVSSPDTLARHVKSTVATNESYIATTSLGDSTLLEAIRISLALKIAQTTAASVTIPAGDSVQINLRIGFTITGFDTAVVQLAETPLPVSLPPMRFMEEGDSSGVKIYQGTFTNSNSFLKNKIKVLNLQSTFPFDLGFYMNFRNFVSADGQDSVKIDTVLNSNVGVVNSTFDIDGYKFANPVSPDSALTEMVIDVNPVIHAGQAFIPLDGSDLGTLSMSISVNTLEFETLDALIITTFPSSQQNIEGMPQGFEGMAFSDVRIEFEIMNTIRLPVQLDIEMVGVTQMADTVRVRVLSAIDTSGIAIYDSAKTLIQLSREGTKTYYYNLPTDSIPSDSVLTGAGEQTIVDLLSANPVSLFVNAQAGITGRGTITTEGFIKFKYRMVAPFEVIMEPMTFISVNETPLQEMDYDTRNTIRSSLYRAELITTVTNHIPVGGEIAIHLSNNTFFPLDTTVEMLRVFRDSMVVQRGWDPTDSLYVVTNCAALNPALDSLQVGSLQLNNLYIFQVMVDYSDCIDGVVYLVKHHAGAVVDTVISYVDTLVKVLLPDPLSLYSDTTTVGYPGAVAEPGMTSYSSVIDTNRIFLITDYGDHYTAPRFHLNGSPWNADMTARQPVYLSVTDYIDIRSSLVFRISSTGMLETSPDEIVILYPNGGETLNTSEEHVIRWKTFGKISTVDLHVATGGDPAESDWLEIATQVVNVDSFLWTPIVTSGINTIMLNPDSVRLRVSDANSAVEDISGWYFSLTSGGRQSGRQSGGSAWLRDKKIGRPLR